MTYLDHYPNCIGCPVSEWCGTAVSSLKLCYSYKDSDEKLTDNNYENNN